MRVSSRSSVCSVIEIANEAERRKVFTIGVTYLPSHYKLAKTHLKGFKFVVPALGLHPLAAKDHGPERELFKKLAAETLYIGEVGLDFSRAAYSTKKEQEVSFQLVCDILSRSKKIVTVHSRQAEDAVLSMLNAVSASPVIFHWFSGSERTLTKILDGGHYLSINTQMIATAKWAAYVRRIPITSLLTETDGPFARHNGVASLPWDVQVVQDWLATKYGVSSTVMAEQLQCNFGRLPLGQ